VWTGGVMDDKTISLLKDIEDWTYDHLSGTKYNCHQQLPYGLSCSIIAACQRKDIDTVKNYLINHPLVYIPTGIVSDIADFRERLKEIP
jgi:hypothetical protein